jgi:hypothetical protein
MRTTINIKASRKKSGSKNSTRELIFKRYEFNHPLNPFRIINRKHRERILHSKTTSFNDGVISCFEKILKAIQRVVVTSEKKELTQLSTLLSDLDRELYAFSTVPFTANIDAKIFEHLNYLLKLLYEWQDYLCFFEKMNESPGSFLRQTSVRESIPMDALIIKVQYLRKIFEQLSREINIEINEILRHIEQERQKNHPRLPKL